MIGTNDDAVTITKKAYSKIHQEYADNAPSTNPAIHPRIDEFIKYLPTNSRSKVLDLGCAAGRETDYLARHNLEVTGCDISPEFIKLAKSNYPDYDFTIADMRQLPFDNNSYDAIWASASFLHIPKKDAERTIREFNRILRPGGIIYLSVMEGDFDGLRENKQMGWPARHFSDYKATELESLLTDKAMKVLSHSSNKTGWGPTFLHYYFKKPE
jgi:SAM-dependent methyltransferase